MRLYMCIHTYRLVVGLTKPSTTPCKAAPSHSTRVSPSVAWWAGEVTERRTGETLAERARLPRKPDLPGKSHRRFPHIRVLALVGCSNSEGARHARSIRQHQAAASIGLPAVSASTGSRHCPRATGKLVGTCARHSKQSPTCHVPVALNNAGTTAASHTPPADSY